MTKQLTLQDNEIAIVVRFVNKTKKQPSKVEVFAVARFVSEYSYKLQIIPHIYDDISKATLICNSRIIRTFTTNSSALRSAIRDVSNVAVQTFSSWAQGEALKDAE